MFGDPLCTETVTIYNRFAVGNPPSLIGYQRTVIKGVMWKEKNYTNSTQTGRSFEGQIVSCTIPKEADQSGKQYIHAGQWALLPADQQLNYWTVNIDETNSDYLILGEGNEITSSYTIDDLKKDFRLISIRSVNNSTHQNILPMWKIEGV